MQNSKYIPPKFRGKYFTCPHCVVCAQQIWTNESDLQIYLSSISDIFFEYRKKIQSHTQVLIEDFLYHIRAQLPRHFTKQRYFISECSNCEELTIWVNGEMVYPLTPTAPSPNDDMPDNVKEIYEEARAVHPYSPRAAAALLRVALEKLTEHLGEKEGSLNTRIKNLKKLGLSHKVIKILDIVRITANEGGSHAGEIDLTGEDNADIVNTLFHLVNIIVERMITEHTKIDNMYNNLPDNKKEGIKNRDS